MKNETVNGTKPFVKFYIWTISRFDLDVKKDGEFTIVNKVPKGQTQETTMTDDKNLFEGECTIEKAQKFLDERYPNHLVLSVRDNLAKVV